MPYDPSTQLAAALRAYRAGDIPWATYEEIRDRLTKAQGGYIPPAEMLASALSPAIGARMQRARETTQKGVMEALGRMGEMAYPPSTDPSRAHATLFPKEITEPIERRIAPIRERAAEELLFPTLEHALYPFEPIIGEQGSGSAFFSGPQQRMFEAERVGTSQRAARLRGLMEGAQRTVAATPAVWARWQSQVLGPWMRQIIPRETATRAGEKLEERLMSIMPGKPEEIRPMAETLIEDQAIHPIVARVMQEVFNVVNIGPAEAVLLGRHLPRAALGAAVRGAARKAAFQVQNLGRVLQGSRAVKTGTFSGIDDAYRFLKEAGETRKDILSNPRVVEAFTPEELTNLKQWIPRSGLKKTRAPKDILSADVAAKERRVAEYKALPDKLHGSHELDALRERRTPFVAFKQRLPDDDPLYIQLQSEGFDFVEAGKTSTFGEPQVHVAFDPDSINASKAMWDELRRMGGKDARETMRQAVVHGEGKLALLKQAAPEAFGVGRPVAYHINVGGRRLAGSTQIAFPGETNAVRREMYRTIEAAQQGDVDALARLGLDEPPAGEITLGVVESKSPVTDAALTSEHINEVMDTLVREEVPEAAAKRAIYSAAQGKADRGVRAAMWHTRGQLPDPATSRKLSTLRAEKVEKIKQYGLKGQQAQALYDKAITGQPVKIPHLEKPAVLSQRLAKEAESQAVSAVERARDAAKAASREVSERLQALGVPKTRAAQATGLVARGKEPIARILSRVKAYQKPLKEASAKADLIASQQRAIEARYGPDLRRLETEAQQLKDQLDLYARAEAEVGRDVTDALAVTHHEQGIPLEAVTSRKTGVPERSMVEYQLAENAAKRKELATARAKDLKALKRQAKGKGIPIRDEGKEVLGSLESLGARIGDIERTLIDDLRKANVVPDTAKQSFRSLRRGNAKGANALVRTEAGKKARARAREITGTRREQAKKLEAELGKVRKQYRAIENEGREATRKLIHDALFGIEAARRPQTALIAARNVPPIQGAPPIQGVGQHTGLENTATMMQHNLRSGSYQPPPGVKGSGPNNTLQPNDMPGTYRLGDSNASSIDIDPGKIPEMEPPALAVARAAGYRSSRIGFKPMHVLVDAFVSPVKGIVGGIGPWGRKVANEIHRKIFERTALADDLAKHYAAMSELLPDPTDRLHASRLVELDLPAVPEQWLKEVEAGVTPLARNVRRWIDEARALTGRIADHLLLPHHKRNDFYIPRMFDPKARALYLQQQKTAARRAYENKEPFNHFDGQPDRPIKDRHTLKEIQDHLEREHRLTKEPGLGYVEDVYEKRKLNRPVDWMHEKRRFGDMQELRMMHPDDIMAHYISAATRTKFLREVNPLIEGLAAKQVGPDAPAVKDQLLAVRDLLMGTGGPMAEDRALHWLIKKGDFIPQDMLLRNPEFVGRTTAMLRHMTFLKYLTMNPSSILVNLTQGPLNNIAAMGSKWYWEGLKKYIKNRGKRDEVMTWLEESGRRGSYGKRWKLGQMDREAMDDIIKHTKGIGEGDFYKYASGPYGWGEDVNIATTMYVGTNKAEALLKEYKRLTRRAMARGVKSQREIDSYVWKNLDPEFKDGVILFREDEVQSAGHALHHRLGREPELTTLPVDADEVEIAARIEKMQRTGLTPDELMAAKRQPAEAGKPYIGALTKQGREARAYFKELGAKQLDPLQDLRAAVDGGLAVEKEFIRKAGLDAVNQLQFAYDKINLPSYAHRSSLARMALQFQDFVRMEFEFILHTMGNPLKSARNFYRWTKLFGLMTALGGPFTLPFFMDLARYSPGFRSIIDKWDKARIKWGDEGLEFDDKEGMPLNFGAWIGRNIASRVALSLGQEYKFDKEGLGYALGETMPALSMVHETFEPAMIAAGTARELAKAEKLDETTLEQSLRAATGPGAGMRATVSAESALGRAGTAIAPALKRALDTAWRMRGFAGGQLAGAATALGQQPEFNPLQSILGLKQVGEVVHGPGAKILRAPPTPLSIPASRVLRELEAEPGALPSKAGRRGFERPGGLGGDIGQAAAYIGFGARPAEPSMLQRQRGTNEVLAALRRGQAQDAAAIGGEDKRFTAARVSSGASPHFDRDAVHRAIETRERTAFARAVSGYPGEEAYAHRKENIPHLTSLWQDAKEQAEATGSVEDWERAQRARIDLQDYIQKAFTSQYDKYALTKPGWTYKQRREAIEDIDNEMLRTARDTGDKDFTEALYAEFIRPQAWLDRVDGQWKTSEWRQAIHDTAEAAIARGEDPVEAVARWINAQAQESRESRRLYAQIYLDTRDFAGTRLYTDFGPGTF